ncbi:MAG: hypothetical protein UT24_C0007G0041 [Candidatus Woesebacteria bacterium GW2011_GWB1_39_12]|uniref:Uncharacterized protein n=2 Tax=Candidatus Woeseibacteriota TaxID=1752722 RepID=A0A0G0PJM1_9BACT|nr:MAG: hypothetical protein UT23_C0004G0119 [Candidatus Woesebacteria bacterium GW2011_GWA1_39_12]KKR01078.1 MAG: hypothetical protein UT24_C0007G0041 [Candidatus Woesebacteria bacterium GW2011_GWB1_39_12]
MHELDPTEISKEVIPDQPEPGEGKSAAIVAVSAFLTFLCVGSTATYWIYTHPKETQDFIDKLAEILRR